MKKILLSDICNIYDGIHSTPNYVDNGIPFMSVENIYTDFDKVKKKVSIDDKKSNHASAKPELNDIFLSRIGSIGKTRVINEDTSLSFYVTLALLKIKVNFNSYYVKYLIDSNRTQREIYKRTLHVAFPQKINLAEIKNIPVNVHIDIETQNKIATLLSSIDNVIDNYKDIRNNLEDKKKYYMNKIFSSTKGTTKVKLGDVFYKVKNNKKSILKKDYLKEGKWPIISQEKEFINGYTDNNDINLYNVNGVILLGDHTLVLKYIDFPFYTGGDGTVLIESDYNNKYIYYLIENNLPNTEGYKRHFSVVKNKMANFHEEINGQIEIANILSKMDDEINNYDYFIENLNMKKRYYLNEIFG